MKNTALSHVHESLGAKMVSFAGYNMPIRYKGLIEEHLIVRNGVGIFDVSHMGEFFIRGEGSKDLIQKLTSNDVDKLIDGKVQYSCFPNLEGGIVDDLLVYRFSEEEYMLVVNASNIEKDWKWIQKFNLHNVLLENKSDKMSLLAVQGPKSIEALNMLTDFDLSTIKYYTFKKVNFAGIENVIISATGYTGSGGFEIYCSNSEVEIIWDAILKSGKDYNIQPIGLAARDTLRLEMGFCLYGNDIDDTTSPIEADLGWITKFTNEFTNSEFLKKQKKQGVKRKLVGFELIDRGVARNNYEIINSEGEKIGKVTSGTMSPSLKKSIGMGYVLNEYSEVNNYIYIKVRQKKIKAKIIKKPFYRG